MTFPEWLQAQLVSQDGKGNEWPAGGGVGTRLKDANGTEIALISQGETVDLYVGRQVFMNVSVSARSLVRLACWILLWWAWNCWFGLRLRAWRWTLRQQLDRRRDEEAPDSVGAGSQSS